MSLEDEEEFVVPDNAFVGPAGLERTIVLETAIDNPFAVDEFDLLDAWSTLSAASVEVSLAGKLDIVDFANECLLFAAIRSPVKVPLPDSVKLKDLGLPHYSAKVSETSYPTHPHDMYPVYQIYDQGYDAEKRSKKDPQEEEQPPYNPFANIALEWKTLGVIYITQSVLPREVHIGVSIIPDYQGRGAGIKACALAVQWAVEMLNVHRVQARIMTSTHRDRAQRLFTAMGFAHEGIQRRAVTDGAGAWVDVTQMGMLDMDWVVRKRCRVAPRSMWDELFDRQQCEREELLRWEEGLGSGLRRTSSTETIREAQRCMETDPFEFSDVAESSGSEASTRSPSPSPSVASSSGASAALAVLSSGDDEPSATWRETQPMLGSDVDDTMSDSEWVVASNHSDVSRSSVEPISRPVSAASWSSFESIGSGSFTSALSDHNENT